jgi:hypothetical protein
MCDTHAPWHTTAELSAQLCCVTVLLCKLPYTLMSFKQNTLLTLNMCKMHGCLALRRVLVQLQDCRLPLLSVTHYTGPTAHRANCTHSHLLTTRCSPPHPTPPHSYRPHPSSPRDSPQPCARGPLQPHPAPTWPLQLCCPTLLHHTPCVSYGESASYL